MVKKNIEKTIKDNNLINSGEHIVIGLSGGPDSVCLFSVLNELKEEIGFQIHAVHVNHGFRPGDAEEDQEYVENLCKANGIKCSIFAYDCNAIAKAESLSSEEAGRKVRYESFRKIAAELAADGVPEAKIKIAVAQNADDQAETVLLRLLRGTGTDGLAGMAYSRKEQNIYVIRPLLDTWRKDIEAYCRECDLEPRIDKTNLQPIYTRNKVRLQLIPYLKENFNTGIMESLNRLSRIAGEDKAYLWECTEKAYEQIEIAPGVLKQQELAQLPPAVRHRVIMKALQMQGLTQDVTAAHLEAADSILRQNGESRTVEFPGGYRMTVRYGEAVFMCGRQEMRQPALKVTIRDMKADGVGDDWHEKTDLLREALPAAKSNGQRCLAAAFDYDKIIAVHGDAEIILRPRREGDYLAIAGGRKKIQNLFVDMKVPKENREHVMLAAIGSEILWMPLQPDAGVMKARYSNRYKLEIDTKKALLLEIICEP